MRKRLPGKMIQLYVHLPHENKQTFSKNRRRQSFTVVFDDRECQGVKHSTTRNHRNAGTEQSSNPEEA